MIRRPPRSPLFPTPPLSGPQFHARRLPRLDGYGNVPMHADVARLGLQIERGDRKSTRLNSSHSQISYAVFCLKKKKRKRLAKQTHLTMRTTHAYHRTFCVHL